MKRKPAHPGRILKNLYLQPLALSMTNLAEILGISRKTLSEVTHERKAVMPEMALRLSQAFGTTPDLWLNLQKKHDLWCVMNCSDDWKRVNPIAELYERKSVSDAQTSEL